MHVCRLVKDPGRRANRLLQSKPRHTAFASLLLVAAEHTISLSGYEGASLLLVRFVCICRASVSIALSRAESRAPQQLCESGRRKPRIEIQLPDNARVRR